MHALNLCCILPIVVLVSFAGVVVLEGTIMARLLGLTYARGRLYALAANLVSWPISGFLLPAEIRSFAAAGGHVGFDLYQFTVALAPACVVATVVDILMLRVIARRGGPGLLRVIFTGVAANLASFTLLVPLWHRALAS